MTWKALQLATRIAGTDDAFGSRDGMQSAIFGPVFWMSIHLTSFNYPVRPTEEDKQNYSTWLWSIGKVLPCRYCRENFAKNMKSAGWAPSVMESRHTFSRFCYELHCAVNVMLGKPSPPFERVREQYKMFRAKCLTNEQKRQLQREQKELGCIRPMHNGKRGQCVINIVPNEEKNTSRIIVDRQCMPRR